MTSDNPAFSTEAWQHNAALYDKILALPFNQELMAGTLAQAPFTHYIIQDAHYLEGFGRALALTAARGPQTGDIVQCAGAAREAILVERALHQEYFTAFAIDEATARSTEPTPICEHYVSYLLRISALAPFPVAMAGLLPCFWIYHEVGRHIHAHAASPNPYQAWIDTYASEDFAEAVRAFIATVDRVAREESNASTHQAMHHAFTRACQLEWMFWHSAYQQEAWPV